MTRAAQRILHVDKFASSAGGGATTYMLDIVTRQRQRGHHAEFFATQGDVDVDTELRRTFPPRPTLDPPPAGAVARIATATQMVWSRRAAAAITRAIDDFRPTVVHCHNIYHQLTPSILRPIERARIPVVMTLHDYKLVCPTYRLIDGDGNHCEACVDGSVVNVVRRRCQNGSASQSAVLMAESGLHRLFGAYRSIDTFLCPSAYLAGLLARGGHGARVRHVPNGLDLDGVSARTSTGTDVVFAGRLSREKGVHHLIEAMRLVDGARLIVCGDGPDRAALERQARDALGTRAEFRGHLDRHAVQEAVRRAAVVAVPSIWAENQPLTILEAMAAAVPVVSGDSPALRELVVEGVSGIAVDPRDHRSFANALDAFVNDPQHQRDIGARARQRVERIHDMEQHLDELEAQYQRSIERRQKRRET